MLHKFIGFSHNNTSKRYELYYLKLRDVMDTQVTAKLTRHSHVVEKELDICKCLLTQLDTDVYLMAAE